MAIDLDWSLPGEYGKPSVPSFAGSAADPYLWTVPIPVSTTYPSPSGITAMSRGEVPLERGMAERGAPLYACTLPSPLTT